MAKGWKQKSLATAIGVDPSKISEWKSGKQSIRVHELQEIARVLGVSAAWLLGESRLEDTLTSDDRLVLAAARHLGHEEAIRRLMGPGKAEARAEEADPRTGQPTRRTKERAG